MNTEKTVRGKASVEKPWLQYYPEALRYFIPSDDTLTDFIKKIIPITTEPVLNFTERLSLSMK